MTSSSLGPVLLRVVSDHTSWADGPAWGGALAAAAVGLFLVSTVSTVICIRRST